MRITLNLDDELARTLKQRTAESGRTMTEILEDPLREARTRESRPARRFKLRWKVMLGAVQPGVDLADRKSLLEVMEGRR